MFQPFLRFYPKAEPPEPAAAPQLVSTLLEILPANTSSVEAAERSLLAGFNPS